MYQRLKAELHYYNLNLQHHQNLHRRLHLTVDMTAFLKYQSKQFLLLMSEVGLLKSLQLHIHRQQVIRLLQQGHILKGHKQFLLFRQKQKKSLLTGHTRQQVVSFLDK